MSTEGATVFNRVRSSIENYIKRLLTLLLFIFTRHRIVFSKTFKIMSYSSFEERIYESYIKFMRNVIEFQSYLENSLSLLSFSMIILMIASLLMVIIVWIGIT